MTEQKKSLIEKMIDLINEEEPTAADIINASFAIVDNLYRDQGAAEKDVQGVLKETVQELNNLLPKEDEKV